MRRLLPVLALLAASAPRAQVYADRPAPPPGSIAGGAAPRSVSAGEAYLYSAAATGGAVALGYVLYQTFPGDPTQDSFTSRDLGLTLMVLGAVAGPSVGNAVLGAEDDVRRALVIKGVGAGIGAGLVVGAFGACFPLGDASTCDALGEPLFVSALVAVGVGLVAGTIYDLATIPENARPARSLVGGGVGLGPGGAPVVGLRVGL